MELEATFNEFTSVYLLIAFCFNASNASDGGFCVIIFTLKVYLFETSSEPAIVQVVTPGSALIRSANTEGLVSLLITCIIPRNGVYVASPKITSTSFIIRYILSLEPLLMSY